MKSFSEYIKEAYNFRLGGSHQKGYKIPFKYFPKDKKELRGIILKLIEERGWDGDFNDIDTSKITSMSYLFCPENISDFNGDIYYWDVSNVETMEEMFCTARKFNQDISQWDTSEVTQMNGMFYEAKSFDQPIGDWNVRKVANTNCMFCDAESFNQDLSKWRLDSVKNISNMFNNASSFNQNISMWRFKKEVLHVDVFEDCPIKEEFKPKFEE